MDTIFMNSGNIKASDPYRLLLNLSDKIKSTNYTKENIKKSYKNHKFEISASTWNDEFELPDGSYSVSDVQDYFE